MNILLIHNYNVRMIEIISALKNIDHPFVEAVGFQEAHDILVEEFIKIHVIIIHYSALSNDPAFLKNIAKNETLKDIPLILSLGNNEYKKIKSFQHTASHQWLQNPFIDNVLYSMIQSAKNDFSQRCALRRENQSRQSVIEAITRGTFRIKTFEQAEALTTMLSQTCPDPERVAFGLFEMLANSIEHGNLEIGNEEKWRLMADNLYRDEITSRLARPEYKDRYVEITFERKNNLISFKIEDQGAGFNHAHYRDMDFLANQTCHGRGIALARATSFDYMEFMGNGSKLFAVTKFSTD